MSVLRLVLESFHAAQAVQYVTAFRKLVELFDH